jgi:hypothetical protein
LLLTEPNVPLTPLAAVRMVYFVVAFQLLPASVETTEPPPSVAVPVARIRSLLPVSVASS